MKTLNQKADTVVNTTTNNKRHIETKPGQHYKISENGKLLKTPALSPKTQQKPTFKPNTAP